MRTITRIRSKDREAQLPDLPIKQVSADGAYPQYIGRSISFSNKHFWAHVSVVCIPETEPGSNFGSRIVQDLMRNSKCWRIEQAARYSEKRLIELADSFMTLDRVDSAIQALLAQDSLTLTSDEPTDAEAASRYESERLYPNGD